MSKIKKWFWPMYLALVFGAATYFHFYGETPGPGPDPEYTIPRARAGTVNFYVPVDVAKSKHYSNALAEIFPTILASDLESEIMAREAAGLTDPILVVTTDIEKKTDQRFPIYRQRLTLEEREGLQDMTRPVESGQKEVGIVIGRALAHALIRIRDWFK